MPSKFLFLIPSAILFGALIDGWPYVYFQILRWVVCASAAFFAYKSFDDDRKIWAGIFCITALLFNPIVPFYMPRDMWTTIDLATGVVFCAYGFLSLQKRG